MKLFSLVAEKKVCLLRLGLGPGPSPGPDSGLAEVVKRLDVTPLSLTLSHGYSLIVTVIHGFIKSETCSL